MNKTTITELSPSNGQDSFYGKAKVIRANGRDWLRSYDSIVASVDDAGKVRRHLDWTSHTTAKHIKSFLSQFACNVTPKMFRDLPVEEYEPIQVTL
jgi:hypothetical protein